MKRTMTALALLLGLAAGGAALVPSGAAHAQGSSQWTNGNHGGALGGGGG
jgi:hypothetical protein